MTPTIPSPRRPGRHRRRPVPTYPDGTYMRLRDPEALRRRIVERRLTYAEVATLAGISAGMVSHLIPAAGRPGARPRKPGCKPETAHAIATALRCPVDELFEPRGRDDPSTGELPIRVAAATR